MNINNKRIINKALYLITIILGIAILILYVFPFFWMISTAVKSPSEITASPPILWPQKPNFSNFSKAIEKISFWTFLLNSSYVTIVSTLILLFTSSTAGYAFWIYKFKGSKFLFALILGLMIIPPQQTLVPLYLICVKLGLLNTYPGLIVQGLTDVFGIFLMRQFLQTVPKELIEAGRIEGVSEWGIFRKIVLPLMNPAIATLAIFTFTKSWNSFLWPLIVSTSKKMYTLQVGVAFFSGQYETDYNLMMAIVILSLLPVVVVYLSFQKQFIQGISLSGMKG